MLGKLGEFLNKDVGALVKDAGKVLNTDMGSLAKGAGKVLNSDLGELLRDPVADQGNATAEAADGATTAAKAPTELPPAVPRSAPVPRAAAQATATPAPPAPARSAAPPTGFDPDATLKLGPGSDATVAMSPGGDTVSALPQLADNLVSRHRRPMPSGTSLLVLLPHSAGEFERSHATPIGELTSDPVTATYSVSGHPVALRLVQCWDEDEARDRLNEVRVQAGKNFRMAEDKSWILGETLQGLVFAWTRGNYAFTATAPKGEISMVRFLFAFPY